MSNRQSVKYNPCINRLDIYVYHVGIVSHDVRDGRARCSVVANASLQQAQIFHYLEWKQNFGGPHFPRAYAHETTDKHKRAHFLRARQPAGLGGKREREHDTKDSTEYLCRVAVAAAFNIFDKVSRVWMRDS